MGADFRSPFLNYFLIRFYHTPIDVSIGLENDTSASFLALHYFLLHNSLRKSGGEA